MVRRKGGCASPSARHSPTGCRGAAGRGSSAPTCAYIYPMIASEVGRTTSGSSSSFFARARHPGDLRREPFDVLGLAFQKAAGDEEREVGVDVARRLDAVVQQANHMLPKRVAIGADHHAAAHRRLVGQLGLVDQVEIPAREVVALGQVLDVARLIRRAASRFSFHRSCLMLPTGISAPRRAELR